MSADTPFGTPSGTRIDRDEPPPRPTVSVIGVGPGDPELLTLGGLRVLRECDLLIHAGPHDRSGFAYSIVAEYLAPTQTVRGAALAMRRGPDDGTVGYDRVARQLAEAATAGRRVGFLTEGDPMLYGTGAYVAEHLARLCPGVDVRVVPGVNALSATAARLGWPIALKDEVVTVCPASYHPRDIGAILDRPGSSCWLKAAGVLPELVAALRDRGRLSRAALVEKVGRPEERVFRNLEDALGVDLSYFSLVLVR